MFQTLADRMVTQMARTGPEPVPEVDPFRMRDFEALFFIREIEISLLRQAFFTFRSAPDRRGVFAMLAGMIISDPLFRMLSLEAERHDVRLSTLIILILRGYPLFNDDE